MTLFLVDMVSPKLALVESFNEKYSLQKKADLAKLTPNNIKSGWKIKISPQPEKKSDNVYPTQSKANLAFDLESGLVLDSSNKNKQLPIASLTKLMTAYLTLKNTSLDKILTVPNFETKLGDSQAGLIPGEQITVRSVLYGLLLNSGSDAAQTLATEISGSQTDFVGKMNQAAISLNLQNTHFANAVGWDENQNYSSTEDMAILSRILLRNSDFSKIVSTKMTTIYTLSGREIILTNTNLLLNNNFLGVKTGYTPGAGECLVSDYSVGNHSLLTVLIGSNNRFGETKTYLDWIHSQFLW
ncbi:MAG: hypothetical protein WCI63_02960 [bacterium]